MKYAYIRMPQSNVITESLNLQVITGFRIAYGSAQECFGVTAGIYA